MKIKRLFALCLTLCLLCGVCSMEAYAKPVYSNVMVLPDNTTTIASEAFSGCPMHTYVLLPYGVQTIQSRAFANTSSMKYITLPASLTYIASDAFSGSSVYGALVAKGSYAHSWCSSKGMRCYLYTGDVVATMSPTSASSGTKVTVTVSLGDIYMEGYETYQWQQSTDNTTWYNCSMTGNKTASMSFNASTTTSKYYYRCAVTDNLNKWYSNSVKLYSGSFKINSAAVSGTTVNLTWEAVANATYDVLMSQNGSSYNTVITDLEDCSYKVDCLAKNTKYWFKVRKNVNGSTETSAAVTATTGTYTSGTVYRALLIGEVNFDPICNRNWGDVQIMASMLRSRYGGTGGTYGVVQKKNLTPSGIQSAISSTFNGADSDDVSLFFIASHGDVSHTGTYAGALSTVSDTGSESYILLSTLAGYLKNVPGKVIVILESCGSGAAVYSNAAEMQADYQKTVNNASAFTSAAIGAFSSVDSEIDLGDEYFEFDENGAVILAEPNTGEFRNSKFYVLTASQYRQLSWGTENGPYNYFTFDLTAGVGTSGGMAADTNSNGRVTLNELYTYIKTYGDARSFYDSDTGTYVHQNVQVYPSGSSYDLFKR